MLREFYATSVVKRTFNSDEIFCYPHPSVEPSFHCCLLALTYERMFAFDTPNKHKDILTKLAK